MPQRPTPSARRTSRLRRTGLVGALALVSAGLAAPAASAAPTPATVKKLADTSWGAGSTSDYLGFTATVRDRLFTLTNRRAGGTTLRVVKNDGTGDAALASTTGSFLQLTAVGDSLYLVERQPNGASRLLLVRPGATSATVVKDVGDQGAYSLTAVGDKLYFVAGDATTGSEPWVSDGTAAGTHMVKDLYPGSTTYGGGGSYANSGGGYAFAPVGGRVVFGAYDGSTQGLFVTDGTAAGTTKIRSDLYLYSSAASPQAGERVLAVHDTADRSGGTQIFRTDGTAAGTQRVLRIDTSRGGVSSSLARIGGKVLLTVNDGQQGSEPWATDGTAAGTAILKDIVAGSGGSVPQDFAAGDGVGYFRTTAGGEYTDLWRTDGTPGGTVRVLDARARNVRYAGAPRAVGTGAYFLDNDGTQYRLWGTDGTADGTMRAVGDTDFLSTTQLLASNDRIVFYGRGADNGSDLYSASLRDTTPPKATITSGPSGLTKDRSPAFTFTADESSTFECRVTGDATTDWAACTSPFAPAALADGSYAVEIRPTDAAGNVGDVVRRAFRVDATAPEVAIARPYDGARYSHFANDKPEMRSDYDCTDAGSGIASCTGTVADGAAFDRPDPGTDPFVTRTFTVSATDEAGNTASRTTTYRVFSFRSLVLDDAPTGYWRLGGGSSPTMDAAAGPSGTFKNEQESVPWGIAGDGDGARRFADTDGNGVADGYASVDGLQATPSYTMSLFFDPADDRRTQSLLQQGGAGAVWYDGSGAVRFRPVDWLPVELSGPVVGDGFHHVVATYAWTPDPLNDQLGTGVATLYVDGKPVDTRTADRKPSGSSTFYVGYGDKAPWFQGEVDEAAVFPTAMSARHVQELFLADPPPVRDGAATSGATPSAGASAGAGTTAPDAGTTPSAPVVAAPSGGGSVLAPDAASPAPAVPTSSTPARPTTPAAPAGAGDACRSATAAERSARSTVRRLTATSRQLARKGRARTASARAQRARVAKQLRTARARLTARERTRDGAC